MANKRGDFIALLSRLYEARTRMNNNMTTLLARLCPKSGDFSYPNYSANDATTLLASTDYPGMLLKYLAHLDRVTPKVNKETRVHFIRSLK